MCSEEKQLSGRLWSNFSLKSGEVRSSSRQAPLLWAVLLNGRNAGHHKNDSHPKIKKLGALIPQSFQKVEPNDGMAAPGLENLSHECTVKEDVD